jgi:hypothetical protein
MVLAHSRHQFARVAFDQRTETWISSRSGVPSVWWCASHDRPGQPQSSRNSRRLRRLRRDLRAESKLPGVGAALWLQGRSGTTCGAEEEGEGRVCRQVRKEQRAQRSLRRKHHRRQWLPGPVGRRNRWQALPWDHSQEAARGLRGGGARGIAGSAGARIRARHLEESHRASRQPCRLRSAHVLRAMAPSPSSMPRPAESRSQPLPQARANVASSFRLRRDGRNEWNARSRTHTSVFRPREKRFPGTKPRTLHCAAGRKSPLQRSDHSMLIRGVDATAGQRSR